MSKAELMYPDLNPMDFVADYTAHINAMTSERLYAKSDIAVQLAWRDAKLRQQDEAIKLALEALTKHCGAYRGHERECDEAIAKLREVQG